MLSTFLRLNLAFGAALAQIGPSDVRAQWLPSTNYAPRLTYGYTRSLYAPGSYFPYYNCYYGPYPSSSKRFVTPDRGGSSNERNSPDGYYAYYNYHYAPYPSSSERFVTP